jgi:hypothetical protein
MIMCGKPDRKVYNTAISHKVGGTKGQGKKTHPPQVVRVGRTMLVVPRYASYATVRHTPFLPSAHSPIEIQNHAPRSVSFENAVMTGAICRPFTAFNDS